MEENKNCTNSNPCCFSKCLKMILPFIVGLAASLAFGWFVFPDLLFTAKEQPFYFSHEAHQDAGLSCTDCHYFRSDGSYAGFPTLEKCVDCHADLDSLQTADPADEATKRAREAEVMFIEQYVIPEKEVPWLAHQKQPDNVFFSHAAHFEKCFTCHSEDNDSMEERLRFGSPENPEKLCSNCHLTLEELDKNPPVQINVLTGYSRTTMKMWECERCHAHPDHYNYNGNGPTDANNACYTCHK